MWAMQYGTTGRVSIADKHMRSNRYLRTTSYTSLQWYNTKVYHCMQPVVPMSQMCRIGLIYYHLLKFHHTSTWISSQYPYKGAHKKRWVVTEQRDIRVYSTQHTSTQITWEVEEHYHKIVLFRSLYTIHPASFTHSHTREHLADSTVPHPRPALYALLCVSGMVV